MPVLIYALNCDFVSGILATDLIIFHILLAYGASNSSNEETEAKKEQLQRELKEWEENRRERDLVNDQHSHEGDTDDPNEENTGKELEAWDELIREGLEKSKNYYTDLIINKLKKFFHKSLGHVTLGSLCFLI